MESFVGNGRSSGGLDETLVFYAIELYLARVYGLRNGVSHG